MEFKFQHIVAFLSLAVVVSHAALPSEDYWNSALPNSPMPKSVKDLLTPTADWMDEKSTNVGVSKGGGVNVNTGGSKPGGTAVNVGHGSVGVHTGKPGRRTNVGVGKGGVTVGTGTKKGKPVYVRVHPGANPFLYKYAATETQLQDNPNVALFFLEKDLRPGQKMNLHFSKTTNQATFLPRQVTDSIPFSSNKFPEILSQFSVNPSSEEAEVMKKTINECEETGIKGEEKLCATSLESMIDFSTSKLGRNVDAISTNAVQKGQTITPKEYSFAAVKQMPGKKAVVCHRMEYAYAVFYCHKTDATAAYKVSMVAADGSKAEAIAVCHRDTASWNPKHLAFTVLKVKPGTVPVCHFLPEDHVVWVPKY